MDTRDWYIQLGVPPKYDVSILAVILATTPYWLWSARIHNAIATAMSIMRCYWWRILTIFTKLFNVNFMKTMYVYIIASKRNGTIYSGVTNNLVRRIYEHRNELIEGFSKRYHIHMLVYYEIYENALTAIEREKKIKHASRKYKLSLIKTMNPDWIDLYEKICQ